MSSTLAVLLKRHRSSAKLTQEELAERAEVSARTVSDVERGLRTRVYRDTAARIADGLGLHGDGRAAFMAASRGPGRTPTSPAAPLPEPPTRLIGREREVESIVEVLARPEIRMVTLTGPGGIGKTRVGLEAARRAPFPDGTYLIDLGEIADPAQVIREIADAVSLPGTRIADVDALADHLRGRSILLVLDTLEHVVDAAPDIAELLAKAAVTVLGTSREALRIRGEHEVPIPTLDLPSEGSIEEVAQAPATALFLERAREILPDLEPDRSDASVIVEICRRLNGLPLAIELAAARVKHMPLSTLRDQLDRAMDVLVSGPRDLPPRQRTMREAIAWSYGLLGPAERAAFVDLSVFSGGWTLEAASAIRGTDALPQISGLVDKNLVVRVAGEEPRWDMLDVVRGFAAEMRRSDAAERRHEGYFLALAEAAEPGLGTSDQPIWLARLGREHDNLRAALRRSIERGDATNALRIGGAVWRFWLIRGHLTEGRRWLAAALEAGERADARVRGRAMWGLAWLAYHQGDQEVVERCASQMLRLADAGDDPVTMRNALTIRGIAELAHGRLADAVATFQRCVDLLGEVPTWLLATSLLNLGTAMAHAGDDRATPILERARGLYLELGDERFAARSVMYLGYAALIEGQPEAARSRIRDSLIAFWELNDLWGIAEALEGVAATSGTGDGAVRAVQLAAAAEALREHVNMRPFPADHAVLEDALARARSVVAHTSWAETWRTGRAMSPDEAVELALQAP